MAVQFGLEIDMTLPSDLKAAVSASGGGKITLVVGAGCSFEAPTSIPLAGTCSSECHDRLVRDGVLVAGECPTPTNLTCLADTVFRKTGHQRLLVEQLSQNYPFKTATPNEGHRLTAALLSEGAIASVLTLNFDLALTTAIGELGVGSTVGIIDGPENMADQKTRNLYYLHRNATADSEKWILRTEKLMTEWRGGWEGVVALKVLATPFVVFAGLGSPAEVLIESTKLIQKAIPKGSRAYQVDPADYDKSEFSKALALDRSAYIPSKWCDFMIALSQRLLTEQTSHLKATALTMIQRDRLSPEDISALLTRLEQIGLLQLGRLRACWLFHDSQMPYYHDDPLARELIVDLLLAAAMIARVRGVIAVLFEDGIVEFHRGNQTVSSLVFVSGRGVRTRIALEAELSTSQRRFRGRATPPTGAIIAGTSDAGTAPVTTPADVLLGEPTESILMGPTPLPIFHIQSLRQNPDECIQVAP
jgi:hypothetical protein